MEIEKMEVGKTYRHKKVGGVASGGMVLEQSYNEYDIPINYDNGQVYRTLTIMDIIGIIVMLISMVAIVKILGWF
jgi:hypothetical protein